MSLFRPADRPLLNAALLLATGVTTTATFAFGWQPEGVPLHDRLIHGLTFAVSVLSILFAHEMGHYLFARRHHIDASLPYFIPLPLIGFGTLGAVIRMRERVTTKDALVDIGAAGPLGGLIVAIPLLALGFHLSVVTPDSTPEPPLFLGRTSLVGLLIQGVHWLQGQPVTAPSASFFGDNLLTLGMQRLMFGVLPPGANVSPHPVLLAAWFGMLVTMMNLMPVGQLDGGHLTHAWLGASRAVRLGKIVALGLAGLALFTTVSWAVWLVVLWKVIRFNHPPLTQPEVPLSRSRQVVCAICAVCFVLTLMPLPFGLQ